METRMNMLALAVDMCFLLQQCHNLTFSEWGGTEFRVSRSVSGRLFAVCDAQLYVGEGLEGLPRPHAWMGDRQ